MYKTANEITENHIRRNFSGLSEKEKAAFFKQLQQDFDQYKSFALKHREQLPEALEMIFKNEIEKTNPDIDISTLSTGLYLLKIESGKEIKEFKLLKN